MLTAFSSTYYSGVGICRNTPYIRNNANLWLRKQIDFEKKYHSDSSHAHTKNTTVDYGYFQSVLITLEVYFWNAFKGRVNY